jgi:glycosyltransferase involved in cell wall biosynthesis
MKVLHVLSSIDPRSGGPVEALRGLACAQAAAGLTVEVVATWTRGANVDLAEQLRQRGVRVDLIGPCWRPLGWHPRLSTIVSEAVGRANIVHIHGLWEEIQHRAARSAWRAGKPYLIRPCGMLDPWSLAQGRLKKALYLRLRLRTDLDRAAALHFTSQPECDLARPLGLRAPAVIEPNGVTLDEYVELPSRGTFRVRHGLDPGRPVVLFLSRLHAKKGLDLLLPAFAQARPRDALLVLAGPDADGYRASLETEVKRLGLSERVLFTGMLQGAEKRAAFVDADLFVLPSYQENFGIAVVEALAAGTPVLISDQVNIHDDVRRAGVGGVVPTAIDPLAAELTRWLTDPDLHAAAAARARPFVRERYDWDRIARRWLDHYQHLAPTR